MSLADELKKLNDLHARGALTDEEFAKAKEAVLSGDAVASVRDDEYLPPPSADQSLGRVASRYIRFQIAMALIAVIAMLVVMFVFVIPNIRNVQKEFDKRIQQKQAP